MTHSLAESLAGEDPVSWAVDWLRAAQFQSTYANVAVVYSWEFAESGGGGGMWNPLNTTQGGYAGETDFNSVGVKNYVDRADGIAANAKVIHNGYYPAVIAAFVRGDDPQATIDAITASPWGTRHIELLAHPAIPTPAPPPPKVIPMLDLHLVARLHDPAGGWWEAYDDGRVDYLNANGAIVAGGMISPSDRAAFAGRHVARLEPRTYRRRLHRHNGYTIIATSGERYVPVQQS